MCQQVEIPSGRERERKVGGKVIKWMKIDAIRKIKLLKGVY